MHYRLAASVVSLLAVALLSLTGCARHHYRQRADRQSYGILREKSDATPWQPPVRYSVEPDPRSRFFNPTDPDDPALPLPAPKLYAYEIPDLSEGFDIPVLCEDGTAPAPTQLTIVKKDAPQQADDQVQPADHQEPAPTPAQPIPTEADLFEIELVQAEEMPPAEPNADAEAEYPSNTSATELRIVEIPPSAWESLPESCLVRMFEFDSLLSEYASTYGNRPTAEQLDQSKRLTLREIVKLAQINSREYQTQKETLYLVALRLTFERYQYEFKFSPANNGTDVNYLHSGQGLTSFERLTVPSQFMLNKVLVTGGDFLARFANDVILTFNGPDGFAADISSELLFDVTQPILQRDIVFEDLTQAERDVVYAARDFARFRKQLFRDLALQYYNLLLSYRQIEIAAQNYFSNVRGFEQGLAEYRAGRLPRFQVDQFEQDALSARNTLIVRCNSLEQSLDQLKLLIGLPTETPLNLDLTELEELTLRDESQVAQERVIRARRNLLSEMQQAKPDQSVLLNGGIELTRRMLRVLEIRDQLGLETPSRPELERQLATLLVAEARLLVRFNRETLQEEQQGTRPTTQLQIFQRILELVDSILNLADRQMQLARVNEMDPERISSVRSDLQKVHSQLIALGDELEAVVPEERIPQLVTRAEALLEEANRLENKAQQLVPDAATSAIGIEETIVAVDHLLKTSDELLGDPEEALSPVKINMDDAMMTALLLRFDLLNQRGRLADAWRQIKLAADDLRSVLNLNASHRLRTEKNRPFGFTLEESDTQLNLSFDAPLNRRSQRNDYRRSLIGYQASQRDVINLEDRIKFDVRSDLRQLQLDQEQYVIAVASAALAFERVVSTRLQLQLGIENVAARDVLEAQRAFAASLSDVASAHITYILDRTDLFLDLEELWVDEDGFWPALYQPQVQPEPHYHFPEYALPVYGTLPPHLWYSKKIKRMLKIPPGQPQVYSTQE